MENKLVLFTIKDKVGNEKWTPDRSLINYPVPSRILICSKPSSGKTSLILNIILNAKPYYKKIYLMHQALKNMDISPDGDDGVDEEAEEAVSEYASIDYIPLYDIPSPNFFKDDDNVKKLLVIDDIDLKHLSKQEKHNIGKILSYSSSHYNMTVIIALQDLFQQATVSIARFCNVFTVFPYADITYNRMLLNRMGISGKLSDKIINELKEYRIHDNITIDYTENSPARYRKNIFIKLNHLEN
jgi:AAA+ ATPase superfamily predicted ATPase